MSLPGQFEVGQLYLGFNRNGLPVWTQPDGIGGLVFPQLPTQMNWFGDPSYNGPGGMYQWPMAYPAQYYAGCGHPLNCWEVYQYADPYNDNAVMALICCPMCSFIQAIMPLAQYQSEQETPMLVV